MDVFRIMHLQSFLRCFERRKRSLRFFQRPLKIQTNLAA